MKLVDIYDKYQIPDELRMHMLRAAAMGKLICSNWTGEKLKEELIVGALLVHDLGNIVKFTTSDPNLLKLKSDFTAKYSADDHKATEAILRELGFSRDFCFFVRRKVFIYTDRVLQEGDFNLKIATYADQRIAPTGVATLQERFDECKIRYNGNPNASVNDPRASEYIKASFEIEKQIRSNCSIDLAKVTNKDLEKEIEKLKAYEFDLV